MRVLRSIYNRILKRKWVWIGIPVSYLALGLILEHTGIYYRFSIVYNIFWPFGLVLTGYITLIAGYLLLRFLFFRGTPIWRRKWLSLSWLVIFGTLALLSLTIGNTIKPRTPPIITNWPPWPDYWRHFNPFLWSPLNTRGLLPWDERTSSWPLYFNVGPFIIGLLWWAFLSFAIVYAGNWLLKRFVFKNLT